MEKAAEFALELEIHEETIIEEHNATSTYTNTTESLKIIDEYGFDSELDVTSDYHLKRSKMIYDRVNDGRYDFKYIKVLGANGETWKELSYADTLWFTELYKLMGLPIRVI